MMIIDLYYILAGMALIFTHISFVSTKKNYIPPLIAAGLWNELSAATSRIKVYSFLGGYGDHTFLSATEWMHPALQDVFFYIAVAMVALVIINVVSSWRESKREESEDEQ